MALIADAAFDAGLSYIRDRVTKVVVCSQEPATYTEALTTYALGNKATPTIGAPQNKTGGGREIVVAAFSDGTMTATGTATHWAIINETNTELLSTGSLTASQAVTIGNPLQVNAFAVSFNDAV